MAKINLGGVKWLVFIPDPSYTTRITDSVWDGDILLDKNRNSRNIQEKFFYQSRDASVANLDPLETFYIVDTQTEAKRWRVEVDGF